MTHDEIQTRKKAMLYANKTIERLRRSEDNPVICDFLEVMHILFKTIMALLDEQEKGNGRT